MKKILGLAYLIFMISCSVSPKEELQKRAIPFTDVAFFDSVKSGNTEVVRLFVDAGMPVDLVNKYEETALMIAIIQQNESMVDALLLRGASVFKVDENGRTPFVLAARSGSVSIMKKLLDKGSDVNERDRKLGFSALNYAVQAQKKDAALWLIQQKADVNLQSKDGGHPLLGAAYNGDLQLLEALVSAGAQVNLATQFGQHALHYAALNGKMEAVQFLLLKGADKSLKDVDGKTPKDLAIENGFTEVARVL
jgi:ankyrin repeat protein